MKTVQNVLFPFTCNKCKNSIGWDCNKRSEPPCYFCISEGLNEKSPVEEYWKDEAETFHKQFNKT